MDSKDMPEDRNAEKRILESARHIFHIKGFGGTKMQEIADDARINKAMLHYYYRSKDKLFEAVFSEAAMDFFPKVMQLIDNDLPVFEKIKSFVHGYIDIVLKNPFVPGFIISELNQNPERLKKFFSRKQIRPPEKFVNQIIKAAREKEIVPTDPMRLMLNIISLCLFPIVARPVIETVFNIPDNKYLRFMEIRKKEVTKFIINSIKVK